MHLHGKHTAASRSRAKLRRLTTGPAQRSIFVVISTLGLLLLSLTLPIGGAQAPLLAASSVLAHPEGTPTPYRDHAMAPITTPGVESHEGDGPSGDAESEEMGHGGSAAQDAHEEESSEGHGESEAKDKHDEAGEEEATAAPDAHDDSADVDEHEEGEEADAHDDSAEVERHEEEGEAGEHSDSEEGAAHGEEHTGPTDLVRTLVLGGFAGINGTIITSAAILRKKNPKKQRPRPAADSTSTGDEVK